MKLRTKSCSCFGKTTCRLRVRSVAGHTSGYLSNFAPQRAATWSGPNIMLPSIRLVIAAIFATVVLMMGGFWLVSTFQIAKTSTGVPPRGASPLDPALADRSERKQTYALTGTRRVNEVSLAGDSPSTNTRVTTAARFDHEETIVETPTNNVGAAGVMKLTSPSRSDDTDQILSVASRPAPTPIATPVVALTEDVATVIDSRRTNADAAITPTASADGRPGGGAIAAEVPTNRGDEGATSTAPGATVSAIPSTTPPDAIAAADPESRAHRASRLRQPPRTRQALRPRQPWHRARRAPQPGQTYQARRTRIVLHRTRRAQQRLKTPQPPTARVRRQLPQRQNVPQVLRSRMRRSRRPRRIRRPRARPGPRPPRVYTRAESAMRRNPRLSRRFFDPARDSSAASRCR